MPAQNWPPVNRSNRRRRHEPGHAPSLPCGRCDRSRGRGHGSSPACIRAIGSDVADLVFAHRRPELRPLHLVSALRLESEGGGGNAPGARVLSQQPARQGVRCRPAGEGGIDRHHGYRFLDLGHRAARARHARPGLRVRQLCARGQGAGRRGRGEPGADAARSHRHARPWGGRPISPRAACTRRVRSARLRS